MIGEVESSKVCEECPQTVLLSFAGFLLSLMVQKSLSGIPGFSVIADTQLSHIVVKDLQEKSPEAVVLFFAELDVMGISQGAQVKVGCNNTIKFLHFWFSLEVMFPCCALQIILEDGEGFL